MKLNLLSLCTLAVALVGAASASATPINSVTSLSSGPLTFTNFTCAFTVTSGSGAANGGCGSVAVSALTPYPAGIEISTATSAGGVISADLSLTFQVTSSAPISSVGLTFTEALLGLQVNSVVENVYASQGGPALATMQVLCSTTPCPANDLTDSATLAKGYTSLYITKDINLSGFSNGSYGNISQVGQTFVTTATPEPLSLTLMGGGLALFGLVGLRRRKQVA